jgi:hypothetical protein
LKGLGTMSGAVGHCRLVGDDRGWTWFVIVRSAEIRALCSCRPGAAGECGHGAEIGAAAEARAGPGDNEGRGPGRSAPT